MTVSHPSTCQMQRLSLTEMSLLHEFWLFLGSKGTLVFSVSRKSNNPEEGVQTVTLPNFGEENDSYSF